MERNKLTNATLTKFVTTTTARRELLRYVDEQIESAALYYIGVPDGKFFTPSDWPSEIYSAKKAYVTLNTIMGYEHSEYNRFIEKKKQIPEFFTVEGIQKIIDLFTLLYAHGLENRPLHSEFRTLKMCRQSELFEGLSTIMPLTSTTKLSAQEIIGLGYGNKQNLAVCTYIFHNGSVFFDMEDLGTAYKKPEEAEVLLLPGNTILTKFCGESDKFRGSDGKPAKLYTADVFAPFFTFTADSDESLKKLVFNENTLSDIKLFFQNLNNFEDEFPKIPFGYAEWKKAFQQLVQRELAKLL